MRWRIHQGENVGVNCAVHLARKVNIGGLSLIWESKDVIVPREAAKYRSRIGKAYLVQPLRVLVGLTDSYPHAWGSGLGEGTFPSEGLYVSTSVLASPSERAICSKKRKRGTRLAYEDKSSELCRVLTRQKRGGSHKSPSDSLGGPHVAANLAPYHYN